MASLLDRCMFTPTSGGTGTWTVSAAVTGYMTPAQAGAVNATTYYYGAESSDKTEWEQGLGTYTVSGTTLARTTVLYSSNSNAAVNFTNPPNVFITLLAENKATPNEYGLIKPYEGMGASVPLAANFSWVNQGDASVVDGTGALVLSAPSNASANCRIQEIAAPSTPFSVYMRAQILSGTNGNCQYGIVARNSTNGRLLFHSIQCLTTPLTYFWQRWASPTSFNANIGTSTSAMLQLPLWLRIDVTSTTVTPYFGMDGRNWGDPLTVETISTYLTASGGGSLDKVGFCYQCLGTKGILAVSVFQTAAPT